jgi:hypothetical protein
LKLVFLCIGDLQGPDLRLFRIAKFLGAPTQVISAARGTPQLGQCLEKAGLDRASCLVFSPSLLKEWIGTYRVPTELISLILSRFSRVIVHGLRPDPFHSQVVSALSEGCLHSVRRVEDKNARYEFARNSQDICEHFAGMSLGPVNPASDRALCVAPGSSNVRTLISIEGRPFMAVANGTGAEVLFVASEDAADPNMQVGDAPLAYYFSRFVPQAMALRYAAGQRCWRPGKPHASIMIDDPLLRKHYGFLNFETLLHLASEHNFHASIAFIPHNFKRNSRQVTRMFHDNAARLSICFHGNDHTGGEFASRDPKLLDALLRVAEARMAFHERMTGIPCDRVMVFPQGNFSCEAMEVLRGHSFSAAVNTNPHPAGQPDRLTIAELAQPAVLEYGNFPLFIRKPVRKTLPQDIAFDLFFGRPVVISEHHDAFHHPDSLVEMAETINSVVPEVRWSNIAGAVGNSVLRRKSPDGTQHVRAYSGSVRVSNDSDTPQQYSITWEGSSGDAYIEKVLADGSALEHFDKDQGGVRLEVELGPHASREFSLVHQNIYSSAGNLGFKWNAQAFLRRRLSEFRDNYLSKNPRVLRAAKTFQRNFLRV